MQFFCALRTGHGTNLVRIAHFDEKGALNCDVTMGTFNKYVTQKRLTPPPPS